MLTKKLAKFRVALTVVLILLVFNKNFGEQKMDLSNILNTASVTMQPQSSVNVPNVLASGGISGSLPGVSDIYTPQPLVSPEGLNQMSSFLQKFMGGWLNNGSTDQTQQPGSSNWGSGYTSGQASTLNSVADARNSMNSSITDRINNSKGGINNSILDFISSLKIGQDTIDSGRANNELTRRRNSASILDMVGNGLRSANTMLANRNAGSSSATGEFAKAWGKVGQQKQSSVNNDFALKENDLNTQQNVLDTQRASGERNIRQSKDDLINGIVNDAQNQLVALNNALIGASLPDRIAIEQEKARIKNEATAALAQFDSMLANELSAVNPMGREGIATKASQLDAAGQASPVDFEYMANPQATFNGNPILDLPIFTGVRKRIGGQ